MFNLDFNSRELQFPTHPRYKEEARRILKDFRQQGLEDHFLLFSSGTTSLSLKGYALSRKALFLNAQAVNEHFQFSSSDIWALSIPYYHVGGLSVLIRAHLLAAKIVDAGPWKPIEWRELIDREKVTVTTVVPTQVFDLITKKLTAPSSLKYLIVGGDFLSQELERQALQLGWPVIRTFGMTEVGSQLATARTVQGEMEVLSIHEIKVMPDGQLRVKTPSLFTNEFKLIGENLHTSNAREMCDENEFFITQDRVALEGRYLKHSGRLDDQIKISGKLVALNSLKEKLSEYTLKHGLFGQMELVIEDDARLGKRFKLLHLPGRNKLTELKQLFDPLELDTQEVTNFDKTDLGKLKKT